MSSTVAANPTPGLLPWLAEPLHNALQIQRAHALLIHGPQGVGQFALAISLAATWLCEARGDAPTSSSAIAPAAAATLAAACGVCTGCRLVQSRSHPDLLVLVPEAMRDALGWNVNESGEEGAFESAGRSGDSSAKRKPSKDIKVDEVRQVVAFSQNTASRSRGKAVVIYPAERMNAIAANALLKTLEEPPGNVRFLLAGSSADALLPTVRSRCQLLPLALPDAGVASAWLAAQGLAQPDVLLTAAGGQPESALSWSRLGLDAAAWLALPGQLQRGDASGLIAWPLPRVVDMLFKLCHDAMRSVAGGAPRYFPAALIDAGASMAALSVWYHELMRIARHDEHPWQAVPTIEMLVAQANTALSPPKSTDR